MPRHLSSEVLAFSQSILGHLRRVPTAVQLLHRVSRTTITTGLLHGRLRHCTLSGPLENLCYLRTGRCLQEKIVLVRHVRGHSKMVQGLSELSEGQSDSAAMGCYPCSQCPSQLGVFSPAPAPRPHQPPIPSSEGFNHLLTIVDRSSSWLEAIPLSSTTTDTIADAFVCG